MTPARQPHPQRCYNKCGHFDMHDHPKTVYCCLTGPGMIMKNEDILLVMDIGCASYQATHTSPPAPEPDEIRPEVIAFAKVMEDTLRKHDGKKTHWRDVSVSFGYLFERVSDEIREAKDEYHVHNPDYHKCVMELVDVANFCMMCYDRIHPADTRSRPHTSAPAPEPDGCSFRVAKMDAMYDNGYAQVAKAAREQVLESVHKRTFQMRHRASSEEVNNEAVVLDYSAVYELLQSLRHQHQGTAAKEA